jgi:dinuclear metal center YbgI/SA1388 family protein
MKIQSICQFMESFAPRRLAEEWDNVGLIVGDRLGKVERVMTCLTVTPETVDEAIAKQVDLIVSHHPLPFRPIKRLTTDNTPSELLWKLARSGVAVYSPHTSFDSAALGINQTLAKKLGIDSPIPLLPAADDPDELGSGRVGKFTDPVSLGDLATRVLGKLAIGGLHVVGDREKIITKVAVACGSGGSFLDAAKRKGCDALVTGEATFHTALDAKANSVALVLVGHYASERFAVEDLAGHIKTEFDALQVWASEDECDPLQWLEC